MSSRRTMSLTPELVALCAREEVETRHELGATPLTEDDFAVLAERLHRQAGGEPLWLFAYGSLIWKPVFEADERRRATAFGWHRSFCLEIRSWRGSPAQPGLMMALDRGGRCDGVVYRLPHSATREGIDAMLRREIGTWENAQAIRWLRVATPEGPVRALVFWAGPSGDGVVRKLPPERVAWVLARACGHVGSGAEYLYNTVAHLEEFGIRDRNLWRLQELVAGEIRTRFANIA